MESTAKFPGSSAHISECPPTNKSEGSDDNSPGSPNIAPAADAFPEGGLRAWLTVLGAFLIQFCGFGYTTSFGVYEDFYTREYLSHSSPSTISWIGSVCSFIIVSGGLVSGRLYDRGYFYPLLYGGSLLQCFSIFMLSLCKQQQLYQIFLAQGIGYGLGCGLVYVPSISIVSHYFHHRRALVMSIVAAGSSLGAVVHPIMLNNTLHKLGFATAVRASAGLVSMITLLACLLMKPRLLPPPTSPSLWASIQNFSKDKKYLICTLGMLTISVGLYFPFFYFQLDAFQHGIPDNFAFYSLVIMNGTAFIGRLSPTFFLPYLGNYGVIHLAIIAASCSSILIFSMIALRSVTSVVVIGIIYGYFSGMVITLMSPLVALLTSNIGELGLRIGFSFAIVAFAGLTGPPIHGALLTQEYHWWRPATFAGIMAALGSICFVLVLALLRHVDLGLEQQSDQRADIENVMR